MSLKKRFIAAPLVLFATFASSAQVPTERFHQTRRAMGTEFAIDLYASDSAKADQWMTLAFDEVDRLEALLSNYKASSELSRVSRDAGSGWVTTDPETYRFLERSLYWSRRSGGAFDITVGPLLKVWGFYAHQGQVPTNAQLAAASARVGWKKVELQGASRSVHFAGGEQLELDPGSIGKGFAVDAVVALLRQQGVTSAFLSAGGSTLYGLGAPPGMEGWPVNIPDPRGRGLPATTILLKDLSLSTGACTEKFFVQNGHRYCHIFDPRLGRPVEGVLQTTVLHISATDSDALSTVVFVLPPAESQQLLASMPDVKALMYRSAAQGPSCIAIHWSTNPCSQKQGQTK